MIIPNSKIERLLFGQQHIYTQDYFYGSHTAYVSEFPHYRSLVEDDEVYLDYLKLSWDYYQPGNNTQSSRWEQLAYFKRLIKDIRDSGLVKKPIKIFQRSDGEYVIIDGNHRSSIALFLGLDLPATVIPVPEALRAIVDVPDQFYGSKKNSMPYQSLYEDGKELVKGRRTDMVRRMEMILPEDLENASVLDLGCNIGSNCFLAISAGAKEAHGLEVSPQITTAAIRLNSFYGQNCRFSVFDLAKPFIPETPYDVVFCFSLVAHLPSKEGIIKTLDASIDKVMYFEGHPETKQKDYDRYLSGYDVELIGYGQTGIHDPSLTRPLFRCLKK